MTESCESLFESVASFCEQHNAEIMAIGRVPDHQDVFVWRAKVRFANGWVFTAHAHTQERVLRHLKRFGPRVAQEEPKAAAAES